MSGPGQGRHRSSAMASQAMAIVAMLAVTLLAACAPNPAPAGPRVEAFHRAVLSGSTISVVSRPAGFTGSGLYDVNWTITDTATSTVIKSVDSVVDGDETIYVVPELSSMGFTQSDSTHLSQFTVSSSGGTSSATYTSTITYTRNGVSKSDSKTETIAWTTPTSPLAANLNANGSGYQINYFSPIVCSPIGSLVTVSVTDAASSSAVGIWTAPFEFSATKTAVPSGTGSSAPLI